MPTTQIPPDHPVATPAAARPDGGDLYDGQRWESVFQDLHATPALLIQLQDDLTRARRREALWMSVVVHLTIIILIVNSARLGGMFSRRTAVAVAPNDWMRQKELTYLELPPDEQKLTKKTDSDIISDKNRIATSRAPRIDPKELKKILDAGRPGTPNPPGQPGQSASPPAMAGQSGPQTQQPDGSPPPPPSENQTAQLQVPSRPAGSKPTFNTNTLSPGSAIQQAARAAAANRGGGYGGDGGDFGLGQGQRGQALGNLDILSDTQGVDFGPYLNRVLHAVKQNWYLHMPESVLDGKKGKVAIEFAILKDGSVTGLQLVSSSGDVPLDRAAWAGITDSNPFPPLPTEFPGQYLSLRFRFYYNPDKSDLQ